MPKFSALFKVKKPVIGVIHVAALPGTPDYGGSNAAIIDLAVEEARIYQRAGIDSLMIENMHDLPYLRREVGPEITSIMAVIGYAVKKETGLPLGIQVLAGANKDAFAAAHAAGLDFIRAEGFVFGHLADEGFMQSDAGEILRYRKAIGAEDVFVLTDVKKKHSSHAISADIDLAETAKAASFFKSDGLVITGTATGQPVDPADLKAVQASNPLPAIIGSGMNLDNLKTYLPICDGMITGSWFKKDGYWANTVDEDRIKAFMDEARRLRGS